MGPYYEYLCKEYSWAQDDALVAKMKATNDAEIAKLEAVIKGLLVRIVAIAGRKSRSGRNNCLCVWCVGGGGGGRGEAPIVPACFCARVESSFPHATPVLAGR